MYSIKAHWNYFKKVINHKFWVFVYCIKINVPLHIALWHDMSKFSPKEWFAYVHFFYNKDGSKRYVRSGRVDENTPKEFQKAWLYHFHKNKHHWQYWINPKADRMNLAIDMPEIYIKEMIADWAGAGKSYNNRVAPIEWYAQNQYEMTLTDNTKKKLIELLRRYFTQ